eukprot:CAMPEP_0197925010 /NCGR_PEP_ID=MMETSP1439-20131203/96677_1 /TAXON_ID=66791 /ORGANISM="Gonyaulax spinifera, Strain CCMP409" /LENGTH=141 /DNA_ID=CAMNT_0043547467 /DNA_START=104 /DNA_END=526 /DNA_ORIENTATION=+
MGLEYAVTPLVEAEGRFLRGAAVAASALVDGHEADALHGHHDRRHWGHRDVVVHCETEGVRLQVFRTPVPGHELRLHFDQMIVLVPKDFCRGAVKEEHVLREHPWRCGEVADFPVAVEAKAKAGFQGHAAAEIEQGGEAEW